VQPTIIRDLSNEPEETPNEEQQNEPGESEEDDANSFMSVSETGELIDDASERPEE